MIKGIRVYFWPELFILKSFYLFEISTYWKELYMHMVNFFKIMNE